MKAQIGMLGLGVMGKNLTLNMRDHGFKVAVYEYAEGIADAFVESEAENTSAVENSGRVLTNRNNACDCDFVFGD